MTQIIAQTPDATFNRRGKVRQFHYNVKDYGAVGDGVTDDLAAITTAFNTMMSDGGGILYSPPGTYLLSNHLVLVGSDFIFEGSGTPTIFKIADNANIEVICFGDAVTACNNVTFRNFAIDGNKDNQPLTSQGGTTERVGLRLRCDAQNCYYMLVENIYAYNTRHNGISIESANYTTVRHCRCEDNDIFGIWWENGSNVNITHNFTSNNTQGGIKVYSCGNGSISNNISKSDDGGALIAQACGITTISGNVAYRAGWHGSDPSTAALGFNISLSNDINFIGNNAYGCYGTGLTVNGTVKSNFSNNIFRRNGQQTDNTYSDILLTNVGGGSSVQDNVFTNNTFRNDTGSFFGNKSAYNISANNATSHIRNLFSNNYFDSPGTAKITNIAPGNIVRNNLGLNPEKYYSQGNVTGSTTFDRVNGDVITATLTGSITVTFNSAWAYGDKLKLILIQDNAGNHTVTWPVNFKKSGGTLTLSNNATAVDIIDMIYNGSSWVEVGRVMGVR